MSLSITGYKYTIVLSHAVCVGNEASADDSHASHESCVGAMRECHAALTGDFFSAAHVPFS